MFKKKTLTHAPFHVWIPKTRVSFFLAGESVQPESVFQIPSNTSSINTTISPPTDLDTYGEQLTETVSNSFAASENVSYFQ